MKYAVINEKGRILRISEEEPKHISEGKSIAEITDEQVLQFESSNSPLFLINENLLSLKAMLWAENPEAVKNNIRRQRNHLLASSDWTQLIDSPLDEIARDAWAVYRQDLRDLTDNIDVNGEVEFPLAP
jgi:hypothetical protein